MCVGSLSQVSSAISSLPSGFDYNSYAVTLYNYVYDIYLSSAYLTASVTVQPSTIANVTSVLTQKISASVSSGNIDGVVQALNTIASTVGAVNCTLTPTTFCASVNRDKCQTLPNTCGSCLSGFSGIIGSANTLCFNLTNSVKTTTSSGQVVVSGDVGSSCTVDSSCIYGYCNNFVCSVPNKACPSSDSSICSGGGTCEFFDSSNTLLSNCSVINSNCVAKCVCYDGYSGVDCSLDPVTAISRDSLRSTLCSG
jgi:hypothetical protein